MHHPNAARFLHLLHDRKIEGIVASSSQCYYTGREEGLSQAIIFLPDVKERGLVVLRGRGIRVA
ncbi:hypothetical protein PEDI_03950 [Persicobacter diffluens]|uniref:Uncharacterized protein n=1 Tax=Persicobacter diffluens TaxID=981 RepID=A0AAN4VU98_9BACT|nr:hypothetical protein PEDI_03950 [Persicobacter diffluens]